VCIWVSEQQHAKEDESVPVPDLKYVSSYVNEEAEAQLLAAIDAQPWLADLKRRVQHYGYRYDYKARKVDPAMYLGPLPGWSQTIVNRLAADGYMAVADQLIVNEYQPGQGIAAHVDCVPCFGPVVCSLTLGSSCVMELTAVRDKQKELLLLDRASLLVLAGAARYDWRHAIPGRQSDKVGEKVISRGRRVSLTFRTVLVELSEWAGSTTH
jgi:alkylated DNA repair dioxygenase AlkB